MRKTITSGILSGKRYMAISLKARDTESVFWCLRFQCIKSISQFSGNCRLKGLDKDFTVKELSTLPKLNKEGHNKSCRAIYRDFSHIAILK